MINLKKTLVLNVDVQNAFGEHAASDKLRSLRASERSEVKAAVALSRAVFQAGGTVVVSKDWHNKPGTKLPDGKIDDRAVEENEIYGEHAVAGTADAELNAPLEAAVREMEKTAGPRRVVPVDGYDTTGRAGSSRLVEVHKNVYDITRRVELDGSMAANQGFIDLLAAQAAGGIESVLVTGKIAEVCVRAAAESIRALFPELDVRVVPDAVSALPEGVAEQIGLDSKEKVLVGLAAQGVRVTPLAELLPAAAFIADGALGR